MDIGRIGADGVARDAFFIAQVQVPFLKLGGEIGREGEDLIYRHNIKKEGGLWKIKGLLATDQKSL